MLKSLNTCYAAFAAYLGRPVPIAPLVVFRLGFGLLMLFSTLRYIYMGWVNTQLIEPLIHFSYYGFSWVKPLPQFGIYLVFSIMALSSIGIALGYFYRLAAVLFFICFTYIELIDVTYYLNHYYFVSLVAFGLIWVPAHRNFSLDVKRNPKLAQRTTPRWTINIFKLQIALVYIFAGLAKINYAWLVEAMPLAIWLPAQSSMPLIGKLFSYSATPYIFSWAGMLFDTLIIFALWYKATRWLAYLAVIIFHTLTGILFQIGIFPLVMIFAVLLFFSPEFHTKLLNQLAKLWGQRQALHARAVSQSSGESPVKPLITVVLTVFFAVQLLLPWRYLLYPGNVFWTEEGYRFAWRVMLMEKAGTATFYVKDGPIGKEGAVINSQFLNAHQEKQMAIQPDLILQYAHFLKQHFQRQGMAHPQVRAEVWVTLNAKPAQLLINPEVNLAAVKDSWAPKTYILPYAK